MPENEGKREKALGTRDTRHTVSVSDGVSVTAVQTLPVGPRAGAVVVYAPGAGSGLDDAFGSYVAPYLAGRGVECWRFQFPYVERGRKAPDRPAVLEATWSAMLAFVRARANESERATKLVIGRRSMGGRIASMVAAKGEPVAGLALFAYPLIPPGRASSDRAEHFQDISVPVLLCCGTRDTFGRPDQFREAASKLPNATLCLLEGADHGFRVAKASGRTREDVWQQACDALAEFIDRLP